MHFFKAEGAGNDFIFFTEEAASCLSCRENTPWGYHRFPVAEKPADIPHAEKETSPPVQKDGQENQETALREWVAALCKRKTGIGADGAVFLSPCAGSGYRMEIRNADGSPAAMCGNALRCAGLLLFHLGGFFESVILTPSGERQVRLTRPPRTPEDEAFVCASLGFPCPLSFRAPPQNDGSPAFFVSVGNPHAVLPVTREELSSPLLAGKAAALSSAVPGGVNVEFCAQNPDGSVSVRVFERGVGETAACGTGAVATAFFLRESQARNTERPYLISMPGGILEVSFSECGEAFLSGPCRLCYEGNLL